MVTVYQYPKCSTCQKALRWLDAHHIPYQSIDIVAAPPSLAVLTKAHGQSGLPIAKLFNTSGKSYREGDFKARLKGWSDALALAELAKDGKLIKRPLVMAGGVVLVGFDSAFYESKLDELRADAP
jgi:arsenate reductase